MRQRGGERQSAAFPGGLVDQHRMPLVSCRSL